MRVLKRKQKGWKTALKLLFANRSICVFAPYARETVIFVYGLYLYYFVGTIVRNLFIPIPTYLLYKYDIIISLSLPLLVFTMKLEYVIELKGFVCIICVYVGVVLWPASLPVIICHAAWPDFDGKKGRVRWLNSIRWFFSIILWFR